VNVLLTGASGYLGSRVAAALAGAHRVVALVRRTSSLARLAPVLPRLELHHAEDGGYEELLRARGIDVVLHCATNYGRGDVPRPDVVEANLVLPLALLEAAMRSGRRVAFVNTDTMLDKDVSDYTLSKKQFREWLRVVSDELVAVNVPIEHFFGPGDDPTKFVTSVLRSLLAGEPRIALTPGDQERDFIYVDDVVSALLAILRFAHGARPGFHEFELGRGEPMKIRAFVELAKALSGNETTVLDFGARPYRRNEVMRIAADTGRLRALGWEPRHDPASGLRLTIEGERT
jgi:nucleoside-diphosphate-sugar epimerase